MVPSPRMVGRSCLHISLCLPPHERATRFDPDVGNRSNTTPLHDTFRTMTPPVRIPADSQNPTSPPCPSPRAHPSRPSAPSATSTTERSRTISKPSRRSCKPPKPARGYLIRTLPRPRLPPPRPLRARRGSSVERTSRLGRSLIRRGWRGLRGIAQGRLQSSHRGPRPFPRLFHRTSVRHLTPSPQSLLHLDPPRRRRRRRPTAPHPPQ